MNVAELICKELGVKVGEHFKYNDEEYKITGNFLIKFFNGLLFENRLDSLLVERLLENKESIIKINNLADSWDVKIYDCAYFCSGSLVFFSERIGDIAVSSVNANKNKDYMELICKKQNLFRKMQRFADVNNGEFVENKKFYILRQTGCLKDKGWSYGITTQYLEPMVVYFSSEHVVRKALKEFETELEEIRLEEQELRGES